jgi:Tetratricopeptide repeat
MPAEHPNTLDTLIAMVDPAVTHCDRGQWKEAEELQLQVKDGSLRLLGDEHPDTLSAMGNFTVMYMLQGG